jgi:hypothetical protein
MAGTVGAIYNGALQLGSAIGYAACGSVQTSVDAHEAQKGGTDGYAGRRAAFRVLLGLVCLQFLAVAVFMRAGHGEYQDETASVEAAGISEKTSIEKESENAEVLQTMSKGGDQV